jgi:hypothetical protein
MPLKNRAVYSKNLSVKKQNPIIRFLFLFICLLYLIIFNVAVSMESPFLEKSGSQSVNAVEKIVGNVI